MKLAKSSVGFSYPYLITLLLKTEIQFSNEELPIYYVIKYTYQKTASAPAHSGWPAVHLPAAMEPIRYRVFSRLCRPLPAGSPERPYPGKKPLPPSQDNHRGYSDPEHRGGASGYTCRLPLQPGSRSREHGNNPLPLYPGCRHSFRNNPLLPGWQDGCKLPGAFLSGSAGPQTSAQ